MRSNLKFTLSCAVAFLSVWLVACDNEVTVENSCAAACEEEHPDGLRAMNTIIGGGCACGTCSPECAQSVCSTKEAPSNACLPCMREGLSGECSHHEGFFEVGCLGNQDCSELVACITACQ